MKNVARTVTVVLLVLLAGSIVAQQSVYQLREGTIESINDHRVVVRMVNGETRELTIPPGTSLTIDGRPAIVPELKPGMLVTADIRTRVTPERVKTVAVRDAEVVQIDGNQLWLKTPTSTKIYTIPPGFQFNVGDHLEGMNELRQGTIVNAEIMYVSEKSIVAEEAELRATTAPAEPMPIPEPQLPKTGSALPLLAFAGLLLIAAGLIVRR
jgi:LPXTG-motif cell wall-anchored protein